jgi:hypothetical protein
MDEQKKEDPLWINVDANGLSTNLAMESLKKETEHLPEDDVYQTHVDSEGNVTKMPHGYWSSWFWSIKGLFMKLIESYSEQYRNNAD